MPTTADRRDDELLTGWGLTNATRATIVDLAPQRHLADVIADGTDGGRLTERGLIARGLGRCYNDAAQNAGGVVVRLDRCDNAIRIDPATGVAILRGGATVRGLIDHGVPLGWFIPVTPGTGNVTIGGAVAADVHGKNHHGHGSIGAHIVSLLVESPCGSQTLTPECRPDRFWATVGGLGLTGVIREVALQMVRVETSLISVDTRRANDLDELLSWLRADDARYSVAWIDSQAKGRHLGRAVLTSGDHAARSRLPVLEAGRDALRINTTRVRATMPPFGINLINRATTAAFNELWYRRAPRARYGELQTIAQFFHPLDGVDRWNRLYGRAGLLQWQCCVPDAAHGIVKTALETLAEYRLVSPMVILKRFGPGNPAPLSFPMPGWTLAVDLPAGSLELSSVLDRLDDLVVESGGRLYLAKDGRMRPQLLPQMYPQLERWRWVRDQMDPDRILSSDLARRLDLIGATGRTQPRATALRDGCNSGSARRA